MFRLSIIGALSIALAACGGGSGGNDPEDTDGVVKEIIDTDNDGISDDLDAFLNNAAASVDEDNDGFPDSWSTGCDADCQSNSSLTLDQSLNDTDNDGATNDVDVFPLDPSETLDSDDDGVGDNSDLFPSDPTEQVDSDNDGTGNNADAFVNNIASSVDADQDGLPDAWNAACDVDCQNNSGLTLDQYLNDTDNDGATNDVDAFPVDASEQLDSDGDGLGNNADAFDNNAAASVDTDEDGLPDVWNLSCNSACQANSGLTLDQYLNDTDNDGATNDVDAFPLDPSEQVDNDNDGVGNNADAFVNDIAASVDTDEDGFPDAWNSSCDTDCQNNSGLTLDQNLNDTDNDGATNNVDAFPADASEQLDSDGDGIGNNADAFDNNASASVDADNDGLPDVWNEACNLDCQTNSGLTLDEHLNDTDNDGVTNDVDAFPTDATEQLDTDEDGIGNNADAFDNNAAASVDEDNDGLPDSWNSNCDTDCQNNSGLTLDQYLNDTDNDGATNNVDAFPTDASEQLDSDGDGIGNNADAFDNNNAVSVDSDNDGLPDAWNVDCDVICQDASGLTLDQYLNDTDNDGANNDLDDLPLDPTETIDTDGDGIGNNADTDDDGDNIADISDPKPLDELNKDVDLADLMDGHRATSHQLFQLGAETGSFVSGVGDINNDGYDDFAISSRKASNISEDANPVHVVFGGARSVIHSQDIRYPIANESLIINSLQKLDGYDAFYKTTKIGDVNGDLIDDLILIGDKYTDGSESGAAIAYLYLGKENGESWSAALTSLDADSKMTFGWPFSAREISINGVGDFNNDGLSDFIVGIYGQSVSGKAYLILGRNTWDAQINIVDGYDSKLNGTDGMAITAAGNIYEGSNGRVIKAGGKFAYKVSGAGDVNDDGYDDIIIGAPDMNYYDTKTGGAYLIFGKETLPASFEVANVDGVNGVFLNPIQVAGYYDQIGKQVSGVGDINNDGIDDVALGSDRTETILLYGKKNWDASHNLRSNSLQINAKVDQLLKLGDFNNDGIDDLVLGTTGSFNIMFGSSNFSSIWDYDYALPILNPGYGKFNGINGVSIDTAWTSGNSTSTSILGVAGDVDGDGKLDLIMGDTAYGESNQGISRILYGYYP